MGTFINLAAALQSQALRREGALPRILKGGTATFLRRLGEGQERRSPYLAAGEEPSAPAPRLTWAAECPSGYAPRLTRRNAKGGAERAGWAE